MAPYVGVTAEFCKTETGCFSMMPGTTLWLQISTKTRMRFVLQWFQFLSQSDTGIFDRQKTEVKSDNVTYCFINYRLNGITSLPKQNTEEPFSKNAASFSEHPQPLSKFHQVSRHQSADGIESVDTRFYFQPIIRKLQVSVLSLFQPIDLRNG